jgi:hypothetical protein
LLGLWSGLKDQELITSPFPFLLVWKWNGCIESNYFNYVNDTQIRLPCKDLKGTEKAKVLLDPFTIGLPNPWKSTLKQICFSFRPFPMHCRYYTHVPMEIWRIKKSLVSYTYGNMKKKVTCVILYSSFFNFLLKNQSILLLNVAFLSLLFPKCFLVFSSVGNTNILI